MELVTFVWGAFSSGVAYDAMKPLLGKGFQKLADFFETGKKEQFETSLQTLLEYDSDLKEKLEKLQRGEKDEGIKISGDRNVVNTGAITQGNGSSLTGDVKNYGR